MFVERTFRSSGAGVTKRRPFFYQHFAPAGAIAVKLYSVNVTLLLRHKPNIINTAKTDGRFKNVRRSFF
jgi:hypothetical protein